MTQYFKVGTQIAFPRSGIHIGNQDFILLSANSGFGIIDVQIFPFIIIHCHFACIYSGNGITDQVLDTAKRQTEGVYGTFQTLK